MLDAVDAHAHRQREVGDEREDRIGADVGDHAPDHRVGDLVEPGEAEQLQRLEQREPEPASATPPATEPPSSAAALPPLCHGHAVTAIAAASAVVDGREPGVMQRDGFRRTRRSD